MSWHSIIWWNADLRHWARLLFFNLVKSKIWLEINTTCGLDWSGRWGRLDCCEIEIGIDGVMTQLMNFKRLHLGMIRNCRPGDCSVAEIPDLILNWRLVILWLEFSELQPGLMTVLWTVLKGKEKLQLWLTEMEFIQLLSFHWTSLAFVPLLQNVFV